MSYMLFQASNFRNSQSTFPK